MPKDEGRRSTKRRSYGEGRGYGKRIARLGTQIKNLAPERWFPVESLAESSLIQDYCSSCLERWVGVQTRRKRVPHPICKIACDSQEIGITACNLQHRVIPSEEDTELSARREKVLETYKRR